ncbi:MAG: glutathione S-transferase [Pseudomonadales bacterium]|nr:glutathione S-transferase [Pseudomonadales bacterium]NRA17314.1 glutathione S-transferase [Oceanospirillaceae bacterium]
MADLILYSFRRCPYAMRARLAIAYAQIQLQLREVVLKNKPQQLLQISPKATVPVLQLCNGQVIEQSLDIMFWALEQRDPDQWLLDKPDPLILIEQCDLQFKPWLDKYKYADRHLEHNLDHYRQHCCEYLTILERQLGNQPYLFGSKKSVADAAIFPFIRQFAHVDRDWFYQSDYPQLQAWLTAQIDSVLFKEIMQKYPAWQLGQQPQMFIE